MIEIRNYLLLFQRLISHITLAYILIFELKLIFVSNRRFKSKQLFVILGLNHIKIRLDLKFRYFSSFFIFHAKYSIFLF